MRSRQWKAHYKPSKTIKAIVLRGRPLQEILAIVILIVPLITGHRESSDLLRGNKGATLQVTPKIPVTEGQLHKVVVMTRPSGGNNYNHDRGVKPSTTTRPSGNNNNSQSTLTGSTLNQVESHEVICFRCGKKGPMSKYCPDPHRCLWHK
jgi:hypothetical protein